MTLEGRQEAHVRDLARLTFRVKQGEGEEEGEEEEDEEEEEEECRQANLNDWSRQLEARLIMFMQFIRKQLPILTAILNGGAAAAEP